MYEEVLHVDIVHYRGFWLPYKNYRGFWLPYRNYRGFWLPYRNYRGGQLPCKHYCALPWSLVTVQTLPWWPITVRSLLRITAVAGYRGKRYRNEKSLPREALIFLKKTSEEIAYFIFRSRFHVSLAVLCFATDCGAVDKPKGNRGRYEVPQTVRAGRMLGSTLNAAEGCFGVLFSTCDAQSPSKRPFQRFTFFSCFTSGRTPSTRATTFNKVTLPIIP